jgi:hypothetical protein
LTSPARPSKLGAVGKRSRTPRSPATRTPAATTAATTATSPSAWRRLSPRFRRANLIGAIALAPLTLVGANTGLQLLALAGLAALVGGAGLAARRRGLAEATFSAPASALAFALVVWLRAGLGAGGFGATAAPGVLVFLQALLALWDAVAAPTLTLAPPLARLAAAAARGPAVRLLVTAGLGALAVRGVMVALTTLATGAFAWAAVAALGAVLLWCWPAPGGTLLARLVGSVAPGGLVLGVATDFNLWTPVSRPLAAACGLLEPSPGRLLVAVLGSAALALATTLLAAAPAAAPSAPTAAAEAEAPPA